MNPRVSIMIPTYGQAAVIGRAVRSALAQDYEPLEVIVADDASPDATGKAVAPYLGDARLHYHRNPTNLGRVGNYRHTFENLVTGEWSINLDGDDYLTDPGFLSRAVSVAREWDAAHPAGPRVMCVVAGGRITRIDEAGRTVHERLLLPPFEEDPHPMPGLEWFKRWNEIRNFFHFGTLVRVEEARKIGFYRRDILSSDIESLLRLIVRGEVIFIKRDVGVWVHHGRNQSSPATPPPWHPNLAWIPGSFEAARGLMPAAELRRRRVDFVQQYGASLFANIAESKAPLGEVARWALAMARTEPAVYVRGYFLRRLARFAWHAIRPKQ